MIPTVVWKCGYVHKEAERTFICVERADVVVQSSGGKVRCRCRRHIGNDRVVTDEEANAYVERRIAMSGCVRA